MKPVMMMAVALGGAVGALARYAITHLTTQRLATPFPVGTLAANVLGCLAIGFCYVWFEHRIENEALRLGLRVGLIGALTTFSTYAIETIDLAHQKQYAFAAANLVGSVVLGLGAAWLGIVLARSVLGVSA